MLGFAVSAPTLLFGNSGILENKSFRRVRKVISADITKVGTLPILRAFAGNHTDYVSPYVLLDEFGPVSLNPGSDPLRVNAHPHAGVTPTTYFLSGSGHHKDSLNYDIQVGKGEFMVFDSARGAIHMEETGNQLFRDGGEFHGFQIWLNTPSKYKWGDPSTAVYQKNIIPSFKGKGFSGKVIIGELFGVKSNVHTHSPAFYYDIELDANGKMEVPVRATDNAFIYVLNGNIETEGRNQIKQNQLVLFERGEEFINLYSIEGARIILLGGQPLNEPLYSYGPFVMNTQEEIKQCIVNYNSGKMGDPSKVN
jgi:quercetin 2,3-dioxygenase